MTTKYYVRACNLHVKTLVIYENLTKSHENDRPSKGNISIDI